MPRMRSVFVSDRCGQRLDCTAAPARAPSADIELLATPRNEFSTPPRLSAAPSPARAIRSDTERQRMWSLEDFDIGRKLGEGRFGKIYLARERQTKCAVVLKCISKDMIRFHGLAHQLRREIELQEYAGRYHPHVLRLFAYFWDEERIFLVLEYADGGNLEMLLDSCAHQRLSEREARAVLRPLLSAFVFLHERDILHRDVKPDNILFKGQQVKLADFSWAVRLDPCDPKRKRRHTVCGTIDYLSPEQIAKRGYTTKADVWSLGVLTYRMLCGTLPFEHFSSREVCIRIATGSVHYPPSLSAEARHFMEAMLCVDDSARISCQEALQHPYMQQLDGTACISDVLSVTGSFKTSPQLIFLSASPQAPLTFYPSAEKDSLYLQQQLDKSKSAKEEKPLNPQQVQSMGGNPIAKGLSASCGSIISVSSSQSSERVSVAGGSFVNVGRLSCSASRWDCPMSKSGFEEFGDSSHGASHSRPRACGSNDNSSGATNMSTQPKTLLEPSLIAVVPLEKTDIELGDEVETNCAVRLRFDESLTSLSQLTPDGSVMVAGTPNRGVGDTTINNSEKSLDSLSVSPIAHA